MADAPPPPVPEGDLYSSYNPVGAMGEMFAPPYIPGYQPSIQAVADWQAKNRNIGSREIEETRMPAMWDARQEQHYNNMFSGDIYGAGNVPSKISFGDPRGQVDPMALRAAAGLGDPGKPYDIDARRASIAQRLMDIRNAQDEYNANIPARHNQWGMPV